MIRTPSTLRMGLLLYVKGVTDRWQRKQGYKCKKRGGWYSYLYSVSYLTLTAGDKGIKCPSVSTTIVQKRTVRGATACHDGDLVSVACHRAPLVAPPPATRAWQGPQGDRLVDALESGHRVAACRGKCLAAVIVLWRPGACRSPGLAGARGAPRQVPCNVLGGLPGKLLLSGSWDTFVSLPGKLLLPGS